MCALKHFNPRFLDKLSTEFETVRALIVFEKTVQAVHFFSASYNRFLLVDLDIGGSVGVKGQSWTTATESNLSWQLKIYRHVDPDSDQKLHHQLLSVHTLKIQLFS